MLRFDNLTLGYDRHPAVHHLSGTVADGALLALIGPNGAGKTTLLRAAADLMKPLGGQIDRAGHAVSDIAYLPQTADIDRSFPISVVDLASSGLWWRRGAFGRITQSDTAVVIEALAAVGLSGFETRWIGSLSGGQMQRLLFARVMVQDARLLLLDEPFNAIDQRTADDLLALMARWHQEGRTIVAALHDLAIVRDHFREALLLARQAVAWGPVADVLTPPNLAEARRMCEAFDEEAAPCVAPAHQREASAA